MGEKRSDTRPAGKGQQGSTRRCAAHGLEIEDGQKRPSQENKDLAETGEIGADGSARDNSAEGAGQAFGGRTVLDGSVSDRRLQAAEGRSADCVGNRRYQFSAQGSSK